MRFYGYFRSSAAWRCRIAFAIKGVAPEFVPIHLRRGEQRTTGYLDLNPQGLVPALEVDGHVLTQSLAIIEWLDETIPDPALLPADPVQKAEVRAFALVIACDIHPINNLRVLERLRNGFGRSQEEIDGWYRQWCAAGLDALEAVARRHAGAGHFLFGDTPGLAEICLVPQMAGARRFGVETGAYTRLTEVEAACNDLPAFASTVPAKQPDCDA